MSPVEKPKKIEEIYQKKTQLEHILLRPDTYIGSVEFISQPMWVFDPENKKMVHRTVNFVPGLYKIFDEILVNAADNKFRDATMDTIKVDINKEENSISIYNNGKGIPVEIHAVEKVYVPELIFGHLLTSSNYDDLEKKVTGGRNGYGAKLCNIFSNEFTIETADLASKRKFRQTFKNNMTVKSEPHVTSNSKEEYTKITFRPDLSKFGMTEFDHDLICLFSKRVYDLAGTVKNVKVFLNGEKLAIRNFKEYTQLYFSELESHGGVDGMPKPMPVYETVGDRWELCVALSDGQFQQVSFVNSIYTYKGGTHVNHVTDQIVSGLVDILKKKNKATPVKPFQVKNHLWVFMNCLIENPAFDSQTKENMTLRPSSFGSKCDISDEFMKRILKTGIVENVLSWVRQRQDKELKKTDGHKSSRLSGIPKLDDANMAGTKQAGKCTLILTEGDSAKALAVSGLSVVGRDYYGVFPLRGKLLNVREATHKQIMDNAEVNQVKQILGLQHGKAYTSTESLRYGHLMIMTDQDHDGSHIKGLLINFIDHFWPSLLKVPGFLVEFITPIVKATKGKTEVCFYTVPEYENWKRDNHDGRGWFIKYYKGLGTSTAADAKRYFTAMTTHLKEFDLMQDWERALVDMAFNKKKADERKEWLKNFQPGTFMDHSVHLIKYSDFINRELILFSMADNIRSIPSMVDGLKPGLRKILFACFKRKLKDEIKVAQLAGYVAEHSAYHHGDASLCASIIGMAQDFVGSNNINLLVPSGQFGTRIQGGKDAASPRYVFTKLSPFARQVYHVDDDPLLDYLNDDGQSIEPEWYAPILPMVLVNGSEGIGTGWSTFIPNYNPMEIANNLMRRLSGQDYQPMMPWYRGFRGSIEPLGSDRFKVSGIIEAVDEDTLHITELPIGSWTQSYKEFLESLLNPATPDKPGSQAPPAQIRDFKEYHTDTTVHFTLSVTPEQMRSAMEEGLEKRFKISTTISLANMVCFDPQGRIKKYASPEQILDEFYDLRLTYYQKRKEYLTDKLTMEWTKLDNKARFIVEINEGKLTIQKKKREILIQELAARGYKAFHGSPSLHATLSDTVGEVSASGYDYLLSMPLWSLTFERVQTLMEEKQEKENELNTLLGQSPKDLWRTDLAALIVMLEDHVAVRATEETSSLLPVPGRKAAKRASPVKKAAPKKPTAAESPERKNAITSSLPARLSTLSSQMTLSSGSKESLHASSTSSMTRSKDSMNDSTESILSLPLTQRIALMLKKDKTDPAPATLSNYFPPAVSSATTQSQPTWSMSTNTSQESREQGRDTPSSSMASIHDSMELSDVEMKPTRANEPVPRKRAAPGAKKAAASVRKPAATTTAATGRAKRAAASKAPVHVIDDSLDLDTDDSIVVTDEEEDDIAVEDDNDDDSDDFSSKPKLKPSRSAKKPRRIIDDDDDEENDDGFL